MKNKMILASLASAFLMSAPAWAEQSSTTGTPAPTAAPKEHHHPMMDKIDTNKDGQVSKDEFMKAQEERFASMDANGDGQISKDEFKAKRKEMSEKRKAWRDKQKAAQEGKSE